MIVRSGNYANEQAVNTVYVSFELSASLFESGQNSGLQGELLVHEMLYSSWRSPVAPELSRIKQIIGNAGVGECFS
jgi:hypothetical protein